MFKIQNNRNPLKLLIVYYCEENKTEKSFSPIVAQWKLQELQISFGPNQPSTDPQCSDTKPTGSYAMATAEAIL